MFIGKTVERDAGLFLLYPCKTLYHMTCIYQLASFFTLATFYIYFHT